MNVGEAERLCTPGPHVVISARLEERAEIAANVAADRIVTSTTILLTRNISCLMQIQKDDYKNCSRKRQTQY